MTYTFVFMAICVFQNMNLVIVEDSYLNVKYKNAYTWLVDDGKKEQESPDSGQAGGSTY